MKLVLRLGMIAVSCSVLSMASQPALACGGCFHGPNTGNPSAAAASVVTGHRMVLSLSPDQTTLWDQVQYAGDPADFAWVLPVGPGARVELGDPAFFEALEAVTATRVMSRVITCPSTGGSFSQAPTSGFGCGASDASAYDSGAGGGGGGGSTDNSQGRDASVHVLHQGTVGPYDTVTLQGTNAASIDTWLTSHGYAIPPDIEPVLASYVAAKSDFIALRLAPGATTQEMTPVRVITPGASPTLPLRMVAAGAGANVAIVLYVMSEGRYVVSNFPEASVPVSELTWDWQTAQSNFATLRQSALEGGGFWTSYSAQGAWFTPTITPTGVPASYAIGVSSYSTLADVYFAQARLNQQTDAPTAMPPALCSYPQGFGASSKVVATCPTTGCTPDVVPASAYACGDWTDMATALVGLHPSDVVVTRLEAILPYASLGQDLTLGASPSQGDVANWHVAPNDLNAPTCPSPPADNTVADTSPRSTSCLCSTERPGLPGAPFVVVMGAAVAGTMRRFARRRARGRSPRAPKG